jgi:hypothetical protein
VCVCVVSNDISTLVQDVRKASVSNAANQGSTGGQRQMSANATPAGGKMKSKKNHSPAATTTTVASGAAVELSGAVPPLVVEHSVNKDAVPAGTFGCVCIYAAVR